MTDDMARDADVTPETVNQLWRNEDMTPHEWLQANWPWSDSGGSENSPLAGQLRAHGEYIATGGVGMTEHQLNRARTFYRTLTEQHLIAVRDPAIPAGRYDAHGGYDLVPRAESDDDLVIRPNEHAPIQPLDYDLWRFPPTWP